MNDALKTRMVALSQLFSDGRPRTYNDVRRKVSGEFAEIKYAVGKMKDMGLLLADYGGQTVIIQASQKLLDLGDGTAEQSHIFVSKPRADTEAEILSVFRQGVSKTAPAISQELGNRTIDTVRHYLKKLVASGHIVATRPKNYRTFYKLAEGAGE